MVSSSLYLVVSHNTVLPRLQHGTCLLMSEVFGCGIGDSLLLFLEHEYDEFFLNNTTNFNKTML